QIMQGVMIEQQKKSAATQILFAEQGELVKQTDGSIHIRLWPGNILKQQDNRWEKISFAEYDFPLIDMGVSSRRERDSLISWSELWQRHQDISQPNYQRRADLEIINRCKVPVECFIFLLVGFCLGIKKTRGRGKDAGAMGFIFLAAYFALSFGLMSLGKKGALPPWIVGILPLILAIWWGGRLFRRLDWQS
ncbi:MAG: LptF/LptG family permease, partial [Bacteriovoracaceae bacterium]|nr:LptF/LptG family permease [Bacteriovoracaceae bacterium]